MAVLVGTPQHAESAGDGVNGATTSSLQSFRTNVGLAARFPAAPRID